MTLQLLQWLENTCSSWSFGNNLSFMLLSTTRIHICSLFKYHISSAAVDDFTLKMMAAALMQIEFFNIRCRWCFRGMADDKALSFLFSYSNRSGRSVNWVRRIFCLHFILVTHSSPYSSRLFWLSIRNFFCWVVWNIIFSLHWAKWIIRRRRPKSRKLLSSCVQFVYNILMTSTSTKSRECNIISLVILTVFFTLSAEQQDKIWTQMYRDFFVFDNVNYRFLIWPDDQALFKVC